MRDFPAQICSKYQAIPLHLAQVLRQHLFGCPRNSPAQFTQSDWAILQLGQDGNLSFPLNQTQRDSDDGLTVRLAGTMDLNQVCRAPARANGNCELLVHSNLFVRTSVAPSRLVQFEQVIPP
jgi:hypothetical protein